MAWTTGKCGAIASRWDFSVVNVLHTGFAAHHPFIEWVPGAVPQEINRPRGGGCEADITNECIPPTPHPLATTNAFIAYAERNLFFEIDKYDEKFILISRIHPRSEIFLLQFAESDKYQRKTNPVKSEEGGKKHKKRRRQR
jgi:hypothetical protein